MKISDKLITIWKNGNYRDANLITAVCIVGFLFLDSWARLSLETQQLIAHKPIYYILFSLYLLFTVSAIAIPSVDFVKTAKKHGIAVIE